MPDVLEVETHVALLKADRKHPSEDLLANSVKYQTPSREKSIA